MWSQRLERFYRWPRSLLAASFAVAGGVFREWGRFGRLRYVSLFGAALGAGVVTAAPSPSLIAFVSVAATSRTMSFSAAMFAVFALTRAAGVAYAASGRARTMDLGRLEAPIAAARYVEPLALAALFVSMVR